MLSRRESTATSRAQRKFIKILSEGATVNLSKQKRKGKNLILHPTSLSIIERDSKNSLETLQP